MATDSDGSDRPGGGGSGDGRPPLRVLFVLYGSLDRVSGGYLYDRRVIGYLRERGARVDLLELAPGPYLLGPLRPAPAALRRALGPSGPADGYDCIVIDELAHPAVVRPVAGRPPHGAPVVTLVHHLRSREPRARLRWAARAMERALLNRSDALIVNSRATADTVRELLDRPVPLFLCPPGSDALPAGPAGRRPARTRPGGPVRLLVTGNLIPRKGLDLLLPLLGAMRDLAWELRVVGGWVDRGYKRKIDRLVRCFGLAGRVHCTGPIAEESLAGEYRAADVFVFPSRYEGFGISLAEAVRAGLPFVAFDAGGIGEAARERSLLAPDGDTARFAALLRRLIAEPEHRSQAARRSRELAAELPGWRETGRAFLAALEETAAAGRGFDR
jgi:glycosyltransferase involved in cell wall biosynthesis